MPAHINDEAKKQITHQPAPWPSIAHENKIKHPLEVIRERTFDGSLRGGDRLSRGAYDKMESMNKHVEGLAPGVCHVHICREPWSTAMVLDLRCNDTYTSELTLLNSTRQIRPCLVI